MRGDGVPGPGGGGPVAGGLVRERPAAAVRGGERGPAGGQAGEGDRAAGRRRAEPGAARRGPDRLLPVAGPAPGRAGVVPPSTPIPSGGCASGSSPRSSATITCQDIKTADMQKVVNAAPTAGEGARLRRALSAMVTAGIAAGYLTSPRLREVHWQPGGRPAPAPPVTLQGESAQFVDPAQIPSAADVARLGAGAGRRAARGPARADGLHRGLHRAAARRAVRPDRRPGRPGRPRHRRGPQGHRGRRPADRRGAQGPQAPQDHLPRPHPAGYPLAEQDRRPHPAGPGRAGRRRPTRSGCCSPPPRHLVAVLQLRPPRPGPRLPPGRLARRRPATAPGPGTACATSCAPPPCSPGNSTPPTSPPSPATPTSAPPWTCTSAPPPASSTAPAQPPHSEGPASRKQPGHRRMPVKAPIEAEISVSCGPGCLLPRWFALCSRNGVHGIQCAVCEAALESGVPELVHGSRLAEYLSVQRFVEQSPE